MTKYAIISGQGKLPEILKQALPDAKIVGFECNLPVLTTDLNVKFGQAGELLNFLRAHQITHIIFAGGLKRPSLKDIIPDNEGAKLLSKLLRGSFFGGDNSLLTTIINFFEERGFAVAGAHEAVPSLLTPAGQLGAVAATVDVKTGIDAAKRLGAKDIGQAVIMESGIALLEEDKNGTANLIARSKGNTGGNAYLAKACKPQQDVRADLPTIGLDTISQLHEAGLKGVVLEAGKSIILEREKVIQKADELGLFVIGA
jgi:DUF1009 family protein